MNSVKLIVLDIETENPKQSGIVAVDIVVSPFN